MKTYSTFKTRIQIFKIVCTISEEHAHVFTITYFSKNPFSEAITSKTYKATTSKLRLRPDGLLPGHLIYGATKLLEHLSLLYHIMVTHHYVPSLMGEGKVVCICKKSKDSSHCSSYRPITLCSVISKIFEKNFTSIFINKMWCGGSTVGFSKWCKGSKCTRNNSRNIGIPP